jgi:hypothetical protein
MKLQLGEIYLNRTKKYLFPAIKTYGDEFTNQINSLQKSAIGIGDFVCERSGINHEKHLFVLIEVKKTSDFVKKLNYFRNHYSYEDDYAFDRFGGDYHMLVIRMPEGFQALPEFRNSKYSKMYSLDEINKYFFPVKRYEEIRKILIQDKNYRVIFAKRIAHDFGDELTEDDLPDDAELDYPIKDVEEIFNLHLKK